MCNGRAVLCCCWVDQDKQLHSLGGQSSGSKIAVVQAPKDFTPPNSAQELWTVCFGNLINNLIVSGG